MRLNDFCDAFDPASIITTDIALLKARNLKNSQNIYHAEEVKYEKNNKIMCPLKGTKQ